MCVEYVYHGTDPWGRVRRRAAYILLHKCCESMCSSSSGSGGSNRNGDGSGTACVVLGHCASHCALLPWLDQQLSLPEGEAGDQTDPGAQAGGQTDADTSPCEKQTGHADLSDNQGHPPRSQPAPESHADHHVSDQKPVACSDHVACSDLGEVWRALAPPADLMQPFEEPLKAKVGCSATSILLLEFEILM
eukprot:scaffold10441_cov19-Tisochrysis_lutea.AAC.1